MCGQIGYTGDQRQAVSALFLVAGDQAGTAGMGRDHRVGPFAPYFQTGADPTQRIDRIQHPRNVESFRRRAVRILALTWE